MSPARRLLRENRGFILFLLGFAFFRTAVADWNPIPSASMRPTLLEGDVVLVNRLAYDLKVPLTRHSLLRLGEPERGDVVTFRSPADETRLIKRVVGLPGDTLELRGGALFVNGERADYAPGEPVRESVGGLDGVPGVRTVESLGGRGHPVQYLDWYGARHDHGPVTIPPGHFFMMGDNRDNSADSRVFGPVERSRLIGRAHHVLVSADILDRWQPRFARTGAAIS